MQISLADPPHSLIAIVIWAPQALCLLDAVAELPEALSMLTAPHDAAPAIEADQARDAQTCARLETLELMLTHKGMWAAQNARTMVCYLSTAQHTRELGQGQRQALRDLLRRPAECIALLRIAVPLT